MGKGSWSAVNIAELIGVGIMSFSVGILRFLYLLRRGRKFRWLDVVLEPCLAVMGGVLVWLLTEITPSPDLFQAAMTSLGAWAGPRTIHWLERKYMGGSRVSDSWTPEGDGK